MKIKQKKKPVGYWQNWENVKSGFEKIIGKNNGEFPTQKYLAENCFFGLLNGIKYHGGMSAVRRGMGYELVKKPDGHYKNWKVFERDMKKIIEENKGVFPSQKRLYEMNYGHLVYGSKHHAGLNVVRKKIGYDLIIKPMGYWGKLRNIKKELQRIIKKLGHFPTHQELKEMRESSLSNAILRHKTHKVRKAMGYSLSRKPNGYYEDWNTFKKEIKRVIRENNDEFPTQKRLKEMSRQELITGIQYHGGFPIVRKKMGYGFLKKPNGYYNGKNIEKELKDIIAENGRGFPTQERFSEMKKSSLNYYVVKYYGSLAVAKEKIGYNEKMRVELARDLEGIARELVA